MFPEFDGTQLWLWSNGIGALVFGGLTVFLALVVRARHDAFRLLTIASGVTALWFLLLSVAPLWSMDGAVLDVAESLRTGLWVLTAAWVVPATGVGGQRARQLRIVAVVGVIALGAISGSHLVLSWLVTDYARGHSVWFVVGTLALTLYGLVLIEQAYRVSDLDARWAIKFLGIGLATLFAFDFVMYSAALIGHRIPLTAWNARGLVDAMAVPLITVSAMRNDRWTSRISVSHRALFSASAVTVAGLYLSVAALGSAFIRRFDSNWSEVAALAFGVAALLALVVLLVSGKARSTLRVLLRKHLLSYRYDYREQWLALTRRLGRDDDGIEVDERAVRAIASAIDSPAGALWIQRDERLVCTSTWNINGAEDIVLEADDPLVVYLARTGWVVDRAHEPQWAARYPDLAWPALFDSVERVRLVLPLFAGPQRFVGVMALAPPRAEFELGWEELDLLKAFGQQVGVYLDYQENSRALTQARQFEAFNRLTAFLMHDLKNIAGQQSLIVQNARKHKHNPEFVDDMIETVEHSVARMESVLDQLRRVSTRDDRAGRVLLDTAIDRVLAGLNQTQPLPVRQGGATHAVVEADGERLTMVLRHIIRNAQDATGPGGDVTVHAAADGARVSITVADDGIGMTREFIRDSLFQPFVSTKSARGMGIGAFQVRDFARAAGGDVAVTSALNEGTRFTLWLPCTYDDAEAGAMGGTNA